jgi:hypothetical protein
MALLKLHQARLFQALQQKWALAHQMAQHSRATSTTVHPLQHEAKFNCPARSQTSARPAVVEIYDWGPWTPKGTHCMQHNRHQPDCPSPPTWSWIEVSSQLSFAVAKENDNENQFLISAKIQMLTSVIIELLIQSRDPGLRLGFRHLEFHHTEE